MRRTLRGGIWNCRRDRDPGTVYAAVSNILTTHALDFLLLSESRQYVRKLQRLPGYRCLSFADHPGQPDTAIMVRDGIPTKGLAIRRMTFDGWVTVRGGQTPPKWMPTVRLAGWLRVAVVHLPPSVRVADRFPRGPIRRVASYRRHMLRLRTWVGRRKRCRALFIGGDWNATPADAGTYSPRWLARKAGLQLAAPKDGTHGKRVIDYALTRGVTGTHRTYDKHGSDHALVVFDIKEN